MREIRQKHFQLSAEEEAEEKEYTHAMETYHQNLMEAKSEKVYLAWAILNNHEAWLSSPFEEGTSSSQDSEESKEERNEEDYQMESTTGRLFREGRPWCTFELIDYRSQLLDYSHNICL